MELFPNPTSINICTNVAFNQQSCYKNFAEVEQPNLIKWSNLIPNLSVPLCTKFYNHIEELLGWQKRDQLVKYLIRMFPRLFYRTMFSSTLVQEAMTNSFCGLCGECNLNPWHLIWLPQISLPEHPSTRKETDHTIWKQRFMFLIQ